MFDVMRGKGSCSSRGLQDVAEKCKKGPEVPVAVFGQCPDGVVGRKGHVEVKDAGRCSENELRLAFCPNSLVLHQQL